jgi:hypothetical protein
VLTGLASAVWNLAVVFFTLRPPVWLITVLLIFVVELRAFWRKRQYEGHYEEEEPSPFDLYKEVHFFGALWRWPYYSNVPSDPWPFCPYCDMELIHSTGGYAAAGGHTVLYCERCDRKILEAQGTLKSIQNRVLREIERKIRTDDWKTAINRGNRRARAGDN